MTDTEKQQCARLAAFVHSRGLTNREYAQLINYSETYTGAVLNGVRAISRGVLNNTVAQFPGFNVEWILTGSGQHLAGEPLQENEYHFTDLLARITALEREVAELKAMLLPKIANT